MNLAIDSPIDHIYTYVHLFSGIFSDCIALDHHTAVVALSVRPQFLNSALTPSYSNPLNSRLKRIKYQTQRALLNLAGCHGGFDEQRRRV